MARFIDWWLTHGLIAWLFAQFIFDLVALMWIITAGRILKIHQDQMIALARALNLPLPKRGYI